MRRSVIEYRDKRLVVFLSLKTAAWINRPFNNVTAVVALGFLDPVSEENEHALLPATMWTSHLAALTCVVVSFWRVSGGEPQIHNSAASQVNSTIASIAEDALSANVTETAAVGSRISTFTTHLPTLKNVVIFICVLTAALITILVVKVVR